jgi:hypothetical protein
MQKISFITSYADTSTHTQDESVNLRAPDSPTHDPFTTGSEDGRVPFYTKITREAAQKTQKNDPLSTGQNQYAESSSQHRHQDVKHTQNIGLREIFSEGRDAKSATAGRRRPPNFAPFGGLFPGKFGSDRTDGFGRRDSRFSENQRRLFGDDGDHDDDDDDDGHAVRSEGGDDELVDVSWAEGEGACKCGCCV